MKLIIGPQGADKTELVLNDVRRRLKEGRSGFRLVAPTTTMAEHLRNRLAREGLLVRPSRITTLSRLVAELAPDAKAVSGPDLALIVEEALERVRPRSFAECMDTPGLASAVASAIEELAGAGCSPDLWTAMGSMQVWTAATMADLGRVYAEVDAELGRRGLLLGPGLFAAASRAVAAGALAGCDALLFDGFFTLSPAETAFIRAAASKTQVTLTLPEWPGAADVRSKLLAMGFKEQRCVAVREMAETEICPAPNIHGEATEIARRILSLKEQGTEFGEMGVIVRAAGPFAALLETTMRRFGIPVRSYLGQPLSSHPVAAWISGIAAAVGSEWEHAATLESLRNPAFRAGQSQAIEAFAARVIDALPGAGLALLRKLASELPGGEAIVETIDTLAWASDWSLSPRPSAEWASALKKLLVLAASPEPSTPESTRIARARAAAISGLSNALDHAAAFLGDDPVGFDRYWRHAWRVIDSTNLRIASTRREAVALLDAYEARQWELPVIFVAGLLEGEFPRHSRIEPILANDLRIRANMQGVALRTREDREQEEQFLFQLALSRAAQLTVLSYPRYDAKGDENLRSFALEQISARPGTPGAVRIRPSNPAPKTPPPLLGSADSAAALRRIHETHGGTALEDFLSCPFLFFARHTLELDKKPARPEERLGPADTGSLVHAVIAEWHKMGRGSIEAVFESLWSSKIEELRVTPGYRAEFERLRALRALRFYAAAPQVDPGFEPRFEEKVTLTLPSGEMVKGKVDRFDISESSECRVIDFKYSRASKLARLKALDEAGALLQLGLYLAALRERGLKPAAAAYVPLRSAEAWKFKENADEMMEAAVARAENAAKRILEGEIMPRPAVEDVCRYCEMRGACRISETRREEPAAGAA